MLFICADQVVYFIDNEDGHHPKFFNLSSSTVEIISSQTVSAFSVVVDSSFVYIANDHLK